MPMASTDSTRDIHSILAQIVSGSQDSTLNATLEGIILSSIINYSDDAIISTTLEGSITSWNKGAENIYGYARSEIIGQNISLLIPKERANEEPEIVRRIIRGDYVQHYETQRMTKDGKLVDVSLTISPLKDLNGRVIGVSKIARDISMRKKLQQLQESLAAIVNNSDDAIVGKSLDGTILSWNKGAERIFGYNEKEVLGKHITILFPDDRINEESIILGKIRNGELVKHYESERIRKDGSRFPVSLTISPIRDANGHIIGASKIARDISDKKRIEEELLQKNRELEAFSYSVSHDLRSPLRKMSTYVQLLQEKDGLAPDIEKNIQLISKNIQKMRDLIDDLLAFSQVTREDLAKVDIDMALLVQDVVKELVDSSDGKVELQVQHLPAASGDRNLLRQVFYNLIANALKYSRNQSRQKIIVGSTYREQKVTYFVSDNGVGFDMKNSDKLFKVFERLHRSAEFEGTGLGLAIVQQIISKHGGEVWAEGKMNEGATFYFWIPGEGE